MTGVSVCAHSSLSNEETPRDFECDPLVQSKQLGLATSLVPQPPVQPQSCAFPIDTHAPGMRRSKK